MKNFDWKTIGNGKVNLIILNGWGMNSKIWWFVAHKLRRYFTLHLIDLPGIGINKTLKPIDIQTIIDILNRYMPKNSIYLGWSLGGLIATNFVLLYPKKSLGLVNVASSPYFIKHNNWPGIEKKKIYSFYYNLVKKYNDTINKFLSLQTLKENKSFKDFEILKKILFHKENRPHQSVLKKGLEMLLSVDLRSKISMINIPFLRIYGSLDNLVPKKISNLINLICPNSQSVIIKNAGHIPFVSHKEEFCSILLEYFSKQIFSTS